MELAELSLLVAEGQKLKDLLTETPEILTFLQLVHDTSKQLNHLPVLSDQLVEVGDAAAVLKTSKATIYRLVRDGQLTPYYLPGSSRMKFWLRDVKAVPRKGGEAREHAVASDPT